MYSSGVAFLTSCSLRYRRPSPARALEAMADEAAPAFDDEDALAAELQDEGVDLPQGAEEEEYQQQQRPPPRATPSAASRDRQRKDDYFVDEEEEEEYVDEGEDRERARKRKLKKEAKQPGGRLAKVRRRGQADPRAGVGQGAHAQGQGGEAGAEEREMWDHVGADSEDDQEGRRTREDEAFIDDAGAQPDPRYPDQYDDDGMQNEDHISSLPQAEEGEEDEEKALRGRGMTGGGRRKKQELTDAQKSLFVEEFQGKLERAAQEDAEANLRGEPAIHKLRILPELISTLRKKQLQKEFLDRGVFTILKNWLEPLPDWSLPNIKIRTAVLRLLGELPIDVGNDERKRQLKESGLGKVVMFLSKLEKEETMQNRMLAKELVDNWSRPIFDKSTHYRSMREYPGERGMPQRRQASSQGMPQREGMGGMGGARVDLDDVDGTSGSQSSQPQEKRQVTRIPQPARVDFVVRPESKVDQAVTADVRGGAHSNNPFMKKLQKMKGTGGQQRIARAEKVSVEGRGLRGM